jgi:hypothetical protein
MLEVTKIYPVNRCSQVPTEKLAHNFQKEQWVHSSLIIRIKDTRNKLVTPISVGNKPCRV